MWKFEHDVSSMINMWYFFAGFFYIWAQASVNSGRRWSNEACSVFFVPLKYSFGVMHGDLKFVV